MGKKIVFISLIIIAIGGVLFLSTRQERLSKVSTQSSTVAPKETSVDYNASFAIFTRGTFRVFTAPMYHNLSTDVFIQADNPNIIRVKKSGITWDDFFKTLPFRLTNECLTTGTGQTFCTGQTSTLKFYLNGVKNDKLLEREIESGDRVLITYGPENETEIRRQIEKVANPTSK